MPELPLENSAYQSIASCACQQTIYRVFRVVEVSSVAFTAIYRGCTVGSFRYSVDKIALTAPFLQQNRQRKDRHA
jgi:hypothetical protein